MRERALPPETVGAEEFRDGCYKNGGIFMCAGTHNSILCNTDHTNQGWGVDKGRMERGC
jgi:hypothetical protein